MTTGRKVVAIGVVAAIGVMAWSTLRNPDRAVVPPSGSDAASAQGESRQQSPVGEPVPDDAGARDVADAAARPTLSPSTAVAGADMPRYLRELGKDQIAEKFSEMLDPGDCSQAIDPDGRIMRCNSVGVLNQRLQEQLKNPDPRWTPLAQRELQAAVDAIGEKSGGRIRTIDVRCGRDVCQILTIAPTSDHNPPGGWDDASRAFGTAQWWKDLGFVDMGQSMTSGPDGQTTYYVTQLTAKPGR